MSEVAIFEIFGPPGLFVGDDLVDLFELFLVDGMFVPVSAPATDVPLRIDDLARDLAERLYLAFARGFPKEFIITAKAGSELRINAAPTAGSGNWISGVLATPDVEAVLDLVLQVAERMEAWSAAIWTRPREASFGARRSALANSLVDLEQSEGPVDGIHPLRYRTAGGSAGVAHRSIVGQPYVDLYGIAALQRLQDEGLASHRGNYWVLRGSETLESWTESQWCSQERRVIDLLGKRFFFDPQTATLPKVWPVLPEVMNRAVALRSETGGACYLRDPNGDVRDIDDLEQVLDAGVVATFARRSRQVIDHMSSMVAEFSFDDQLFWVEETIADRPEAERSTLGHNYGAWLGEYVRERVDGQWVKDSTGAWQVRGADGRTWDVFAAVTRFLADKEQRLKTFVAEIDNH